ncbi:MAG: TldD/PmbA family protein [Oscillospiraceae bacterium]|nr:TldD/PmbA family protein [Oscillospiraceae bacterium]
MTWNEFRAEAFRFALEQGCEAAETYYAASESLQIHALGENIDRYTVSRDGGMSLRVKLAGKDGYAYTETPEDPEALVLRAMDNARTIEVTDPHPMQTPQTYAEVEDKIPELCTLSEQELMAKALELEKLATSLDPRVIKTEASSVAVGKGTVEIHNTLGLSASRSGNEAQCMTIPVGKDGDEVKVNGAFRSGAEASDVEACAKEAVENVVSCFGAKPVSSGKWRVILRNDAAASLLRGFSGMFSAEEAQKGASLLDGKEGEVIAASCITVVDDPFHERAPQAFDDEGTCCVTKNVVDGGVLTTLLHNLKTAVKAGCQSTGNGIRASAASPVSVGTTNFYVKPGDTDFDTLLSQLGDGLVITDLEGLHAGLNPISGDFSLKAEGYRVEGGKRTVPVGQITVGGNFLTLLKSVEVVGSDLRFTFGGTGSPSLLIPEIMVAGE